MAQSGEGEVCSDTWFPYGNMFPYSLQLLLEIKTTIKRVTLPGSTKELVVPGSRNSKASMGNVRSKEQEGKQGAETQPGSIPEGSLPNVGLCHSSQLHGGTKAGWQLQKGRVCVLLPRVCDFCVPLTLLFANKEKEGEEAFC